MSTRSTSVATASLGAFWEVADGTHTVREATD